MSHFVVLVIATRGGEAAVEPLLAPYDENTKVAPYERPCRCIGSKARADAEKQLAKAHGTWQQAKDDFNRAHKPKRQRAKAGALTPEESKAEAEAAFAQMEAQQAEYEEQVYKPRIAFTDAIIAAHPDKDKPDPKCDECGGKGVVTSQYNPQSKWDWWTVGGRWTGMLTGFDPDSDPLNFEVCFLCMGTGKRPDMPEQKQCNGCEGTGMARKFSPAPYKGDVQFVKTVDWTNEEHIPYAVVTPDGKWHERGEMGWFGMSSGDKPKGEWADEVRGLMARYGDGYQVTVVDCHI